MQGVVLNWGYRNEPDVTVRLSDYGYEASQVTSTEGRYDFRGLGAGYAVLQPLLSDSQRQQLNVYTNEVAVRLRCEAQPVANLGLYSGNVPPHPPASLTVAADPTTARPGDEVRFHFVVRNGLPTGISKVMVTDLFPAPLSIVEAQVGRGAAEVLDGRMLALDVGAMSSGEEVTATVTVKIDETALPGQEAVNRTSLLYAESMADQVVTNLMVSRGVTVHNGDRGLKLVVAPAFTAAPAVSLTPVFILPPVRPISHTLSQTGTLPAGEGPDGAPGTLPTTGADLEILPLSLLGLTGLWALARLIRLRVIG